ncbi:unnamed protein product [Amoebophrya sp. A25]|nr:unnamed protein product [Amoebophrya sp. A25]|eukprot:GSA25T00018135001.1
MTQVACRRLGDALGHRIETFTRRGVSSCSSALRPDALSALRRGDILKTRNPACPPSSNEIASGGSHGTAVLRSREKAQCGSLAGPSVSASSSTRRHFSSKPIGRALSSSSSATGLRDLQYGLHSLRSPRILAGPLTRAVAEARRAFSVAAAAPPNEDQDHGFSMPATSAGDASPQPAAAAKKRKVLVGKHGGAGGSIFFLLSCGAAGLAIIYQDELMQQLEDRFGHFDNSIFDEFNHHSREFFMGIADILVPPPAEPWLLDFETLKYPANLPTLVIDLDKVVCKLEFDRKSGWQVRKRPGADRFFSELQHYYEIVVFSDDVFPVASDVMQAWGVPVGGVLHREFCQRWYKHFRKDIGKLGRNLERVIHIEHDPIAVEKHPANAIVLPAFDGDENDTALLDLIDFLKAAMHQNDVRDFLKRYGGDGDVGKRYMLEKQEREQLVAKRRSTFNFAGGGNRRTTVRTDPMGRRF